MLRKYAMDAAIRFAIRKVSDHKTYFTTRSVAVHLREIGMTGESPWLPSVVSAMARAFPNTMILVDPLKTYIYVDWS